MFRPTTLAALAALASLSSSLAQAQQTGKAHVLFIPNEQQNALSFADRSKAGGLTLGTTGVDGSGNLSVSLSGQSEKARSFPGTLNYNGLTAVESLPSVGATVFVPTACVGVDDCADDRALIASDKAGAATLGSSSYGVFARGADNPNGVRNEWYGAGFAGTPTAASELAAFKTNKIKANYEGSFIGILVENHVAGVNGQNKPVYETSGSFMTGNAKLQADFKNGNVTGKVDGIKISDSPTDKEAMAIDQGIYMKAKIKGSKYAGNASILRGTGANRGGGSVSKSAVNGEFYGTNAAETAGALRLEGQITPTSGGVALKGDDGKIIQNKPIGIVGSFGAVKK